MAKRFIDTGIFDSPSIRALPTLYKCFWVYLFCACDHAAIWCVDFEKASVLCGGKITKENAEEKFNGKYVKIDNGYRWFLPGFLKFQYPKGLNSNVVAHVSVMEILTSFGLWDIEKSTVRQPLVKGYYEGLQDKDKDLDKDLDKDKGKFKKPCVETLTMKFQEKGIKLDASKFMAEKFFNHYESNGWMVGKNKMKSWPASVAGWVARNKERNQKPKQKESNTQQVDDPDDYFEKEVK